MGATIIGGSTSFTQRFSSESVAVANPLAIKRRYILGGSTRYAFDFSAYITFEYLNPRLLWDKTGDNSIAPKIWSGLPTTVNIQQLILSELADNVTARILYIDPGTNVVSYGNAPAVFPGFTDLFTDYGFTDNSVDWDTAYGWGDHALAGYLIAETDPDFNAWIAATPPLYPGGWYDAVQNTIPLSAFNDDLSYLVMAGSDKEVLFNSSGAIGASPALKFDTDSLIVNNAVRSPSAANSGQSGTDLMIKAGDAWAGTSGSSYGMLYLSPGNAYSAGVLGGIIYLGNSTYNGVGITFQAIGTQTNIEVGFTPKGIGNVNIGASTGGWVNLRSLYGIAIYSTAVTFSSADSVIQGGGEGSAAGWALTLRGGAGGSGGGNYNGGNLYLYGGSKGGTGTRGNVHFGDGSAGYLPARSSETDIVYFDASTGKISYGTIEETDPIFTASDVFGVTADDIDNWNSAFGWGDHGLAGYVVGMPALTDLTDVFGTPTEDKQFPVWNQAELRFEFDETIIDIEGIPLTEKTKLEDDTNWNPLTYAYVGVAITGTFVSQRHYDADYMFHCVGSDNNWIRLPRA